MGPVFATDQVDDVIQREPIEFLDPELRGRLKAIGIEKGKPFAPDERMTRLLKEGVAIGNATARAWAEKTNGGLGLVGKLMTSLSLPRKSLLTLWVKAGDFPTDWQSVDLCRGS